MCTEKRKGRWCRVKSEHAGSVPSPALDCPVAWPRPGEGFGLGGEPFVDDDLGMWVVSSYRDLDQVLRDAETFSSRWVLGPDRSAAHDALAGSGDPRAEVALN